MPDSKLRVPLACFALALLLAVLAGPGAGQALRLAGHVTGTCHHVPSERRDPPVCEAYETDAAGELAESDCGERLPADHPGVRAERRMVRSVMVDTRTPAGKYVNESSGEVVASVRDGGLVLPLGGGHSVSKRLRLADGEPCCHEIASSLTVVVSASVYAEVGPRRGSFGVGTGSATGYGRISADCHPGITTERRVQVSSFAVLRRGPMGRLLGNALIEVRTDGALTESFNPPYPNEELENEAVHSESFTLQQPAGAGVGQLATGDFEGTQSAAAFAAPGAGNAAKARGRALVDYVTLWDAVDGGYVKPD